MDQFLPGDIAVMVLRYIAGCGCENTAMSMIEEHPMMRYYVPPRDPSSSIQDYLRNLSRPTLTPSIGDLLNDYARSRVLVAEMVKTQGGKLNQCDSLGTMLKDISVSKEMKNSRDVGINTEDLPSKTNTRPLMVDCGSNTEAIRRVEFSSQTDGYEEQEDLTVENADVVPYIFYNTLMSDVSMQQKLASTINEHLTQANSENDVDKALQKVCSKAELEIDKFMFDLLRDESNSNDMTSSGGGASAFSAPAVAPADEGFTSFFRDADSLIYKEDANKNSSPVPANSNHIKPPTPSFSDKFMKTDQPHAPKEATPSIAVKRIVPKPAPKISPRPNPVFEIAETNIVKKFVSSEGPSYSIIKQGVTPVKSDWEKLGRRPIFPKTDAPNLFNVVANPDAQKKNTNEGCNKRKANFITPVKLTPEKAQSSGVNFVQSNHNTKEKEAVSALTSLYQQVTEPITPTSSPSHSQQVERPKPPTVQTFPDNGLPRLMLVVPSPCKKSADDPQLFAHKKSPAEKLNDTGTILLESENIPQVTPRLESIPSDTEEIDNLQNQTSDNNEMSPRLAGLIASTHNLKPTNSRKSWSTPRKKYVRNLTFATPPNLKGTELSHFIAELHEKVENAGTEKSLSPPRKRKKSDTSPEEVQFKSKKKLYWSDMEDVQSSYTLQILPQTEQQTTHATPIKELPFQIIPAPIGFPDPTPVKSSAPLHTEQSSHSLITPVKTANSNSISPPQTLPPTPRYIVHENSLDSTNSNSFGFLVREDFFKVTENLSTPYKLGTGLGPPATPGRTIFIDERSHSSNSITTTAVDPTTAESTGNKEVGKALGKHLSSPIIPASRRPQHPHPQLQTGPTTPPPSLPIPSHVSINRTTPTVIVSEINSTTSGDVLFQVPNVVPPKRIPSKQIAAARKPPDPAPPTPVVASAPSKHRKSLKTNKAPSTVGPSKSRKSVGTNNDTSASKDHALPSNAIEFNLNGKKQFLMLSQEERTLSPLEPHPSSQSTTVKPQLLWSSAKQITEKQTQSSSSRDIHTPASRPFSGLQLQLRNTLIKTNVNLKNFVTKVEGSVKK